jgi:hypothetical protein
MLQLDYKNKKNEMKNKVLFLLGLVFSSALVLSFALTSGRIEASTTVGNDYMATTTDNTWATQPIKQLKPCTSVCPSVLGSINITNATALGTIKVYNATTSDITKRTGQTATSSITLVNMSSTALGGTYTFDIDAPIGLLVEVGTTAGVASSTITYR